MSSEGATDAAPLRLIVVLTVATALGPFAIQIFIPAVPIIQGHFGASAALAQLAFSLSVFAVALSTLIYGPVSDVVGRRPAMIGGLVLFLIGTVMCWAATTIGWLIVGRIVQAAGGAAGLVLTRAIVRDLYEREQAASAIAYMTMGRVLAPMLAPLVGGLLLDGVGWRALFALSAVLGALALAAVHRDLAETAPRIGRSLSIGGILGGFGQLVRLPAFCAYALQGAFAMATAYAFFAGASLLVIGTYQRSASAYGLWFVMVVAAYVAGNGVAARASVRIGSERMILLGSVGTLVASAAALGLALGGRWTPVAIFVPAAGVGFASGLSMPNVQAAAVSVAPQLAGAASGLATFVQMGLAALVAQLVGIAHDDTPYPMTMIMTGCAVLALVAAVLAIRWERRQDLR